MTPQDFTDAFILWFSGAAEMKNEREIWWNGDDADAIGGRVSIEFPDNTPSYAIVTADYNRDGTGRLWRKAEYRNGLKDGIETCYDDDGEVWLRRKFRKGEHIRYLRSEDE